VAVREQVILPFRSRGEATFNNYCIVLHASG